MTVKYGRKNRASRSRKRKFHGNQFSKDKEDVAMCSLTEEENTQQDIIPEEETGEKEIVEVEGETVTVTSASAKKLKIKPVPEGYIEDNIDWNIIVNTSLLIDFFQKLSKRPLCGHDITIIHI